MFSFTTLIPPQTRCVYLFILGIVLIMPASQSLEIIEIKGPSVVVNGSKSQLVLDCQYNLTEFDKEGMVVKWYYNRQPFPVYQWIPHNEPQDLGILKGRLNLNYQVSEDVYSKHRALAILNPTTELTGEYTCWISSFNSEDFERKRLIVYSPAVDMSMTHIKPREDSVIVSCRAGGIYPAPDIALYRSSSNSKEAIEGAKIETTHFPELRSYNISIEHEIYDRELVSETMFECVLSIPGTDYRQKEEILYFPGPPTTTTTTTTTTTSTTTTTTSTTTSTTPIPPPIYNGEDDEDEDDDSVNADNDKRDSEDQIKEIKEDKPHVAESVSGAESCIARFTLVYLPFLLVMHRYYLQ